MIVGEVHTALLQTSRAVSPGAASQLLEKLASEPARTRSRPVRIAWTPDLLTGVDCDARSRSERRDRLVGTLQSRVSLVEGHLLQAGTWTTVRHDPHGRRRAWSHYLANPGTVELLKAVRDTDVAAGFLAGPGKPHDLDVGGVNSHLLFTVQGSPGLDRRTPFSGRRTRLRWVARPSSDDVQRVVFTIGSDGVRTLTLDTSLDDARVLHEFCADLALHDWLLSTMRDAVDRALSGRHPRERVLAGLRVVIENLAHTWMPGVRVDDALAPLWQELEGRARLSVQWDNTVTRVRDYVAVSLAEGLFLHRHTSELSGTGPPQER